MTTQRKMFLVCTALVLVLGLLASVMVAFPAQSHASQASAPMAVSAGWCGKGCANSNAAFNGDMPGVLDSFPTEVPPATSGQ